MPSFREVPCVFCDKRFSWQNDANPHSQRICCQSCEEKAGRQEYTCRFCGKHELNRWHDENFMLRCRLECCFLCGCWVRLLTKPHENTIITPGYEHFQAGWFGIRQHQPRGEFLGFGGRIFKVTWESGKVDYTNNLWSQGDIEPIWQKHFTPNVLELKSVDPRDVPSELLTLSL